MAYARHFAEASRQFRPTPIRLLFIAEAPPALRSGRFFYFASLTNGDTLFLEMMKVLYPNDIGFVEEGHEKVSRFDAKRTRKQKERLLGQFKRDGFYLIDALEQPMPEHASTATKEQMIRNALPELRNKLWRIYRQGDVPVILIGAVTYSVCEVFLRREGFRILNEGMINHPARGGQRLFRRKLTAVLRAFTDASPAGNT
jgi:hypothetical protein